MNSIEQVFSKLKHLLRKAEARTVATIGVTIGELLANECTNYFKNAGYGLT